MPEQQPTEATIACEGKRALSRSGRGLDQGWSNVLLFNNQLQRPNFLNKKVAEGELLGQQPHVFIHLGLRRLLRQRWSIVLRFDNQLQQPNLLIEKVTEGKLFG
jgi:hypothetical protein